jgi:dipeptidyl aminopeptidase/acylaminoacyl peptidase
MSGGCRSWELLSNMIASDFTFAIGAYECRGCYYVPDSRGPLKKLPTIVIVSGGQGMRSTATADDREEGLITLAKHFADQGFVACCYDGQGQGSPPIGYRDGHHRAIEDLQAVLTHLRDDCDAVDGSCVGLFGQSLGGMAAAWVAKADSRIRSLILWGTQPRYSDWKEKQLSESDGTFEKLWENVKKAPQWQNKTVEDFKGSFTTFDPIDFIGEVKQPILFAGSSADKKYFKRSDQLSFFGAAKGTKRAAFFEIKGEKHRFQPSSPGFALLANIFSTWFLETIR